MAAGARTTGGQASGLAGRLWHTRPVHTDLSPKSAFDLSGRVAIVTGAGGGIGRTTAEVLAAAGAVVYCADLRSEPAEETARAINAAGPTRAHSRTVDVSHAEEVDSLVLEAMDAFGHVDVMCNVAGMMIDGPILELTGVDLDAMLAVNLKGVLYGCQSAGRAMVRQHAGSIINMSSAAALAPAPGIGAYAISKAAVLQLTRTMATEVGRKGVRVNAVAPGFVPTDMTSRYYRRPDGTIDEELREQVLSPMRRSAPLGRVGETADIAWCVLYLAADASSFVTGQCLSPNGGVAMH